MPYNLNTAKFLQNKYVGIFENEGGFFVVVWSAEKFWVVILFSTPNTHERTREGQLTETSKHYPQFINEKKKKEEKPIIVTDSFLQQSHIIGT